MWQADPEGVKILDVRTPEEWVFTGHAADGDERSRSPSWRTPGTTRRRAFPWSLNPDFVDAREGALLSGRHAPRHVPLRRPRGDGDQPAGRRGFTKAYNILDGMEGDEVNDPDSVFDGMRRKNGWRCPACRGRTTSTRDGWRSPSARPRTSTRATPRTDRTRRGRWALPTAPSTGSRQPERQLSFTRVNPAAEAGR